jgi:hypothetical protein
LCNFYFLGLGQNTTSIKGALLSYGFIAICTFAPAIFTFLITRTLIRLLANNVTLTRTFGVLSLELVSIKGIILVFAAIIGMGSVRILIFAIQHQLPVNSGAALMIAFITIMVALNTTVIFPATLAVSVFHVIVCVVALILHVVAKASLTMELLLQGIVKTKRVAFGSCAVVIAGLIAMSHVAIAYLHPIRWFEQFWGWQAGLDAIVIRNTTAFLIRLWLQNTSG